MSAISLGQRVCQAARQWEVREKGFSPCKSIVLFLLASLGPILISLAVEHIIGEGWILVGVPFFLCTLHTVFIVANRIKEKVIFSSEEKKFQRYYLLMDREIDRELAWLKQSSTYNPEDKLQKCPECLFDLMTNYFSPDDWTVFKTTSKHGYRKYLHRLSNEQVSTMIRYRIRKIERNMWSTLNSLLEKRLQMNHLSEQEKKLKKIHSAFYVYHNEFLNQWVSEMKKEIKGG